MLTRATALGAVLAIWTACGGSTSPSTSDTSGTGGSAGAGGSGTDGTGGTAGASAGTAGAAGVMGGAAGATGGAAGATGGAAGATGGAAGAADASVDQRDSGEDGRDGGKDADASVDADARDSARPDRDGGAGTHRDVDGDRYAGCTLAGTDPFGATLFANVAFPLDDGGTRTYPVTQQIYFPTGRAPLAAVVLSAGAGESGNVTRGTLDATGNVMGLSVFDSCGNGIENGALTSPTSGLAGTAHQNADPLSNSDALVILRAPARLCPNAKPPDPAVSIRRSSIRATATIEMTLTTPVDLATRATINIIGNNRALVTSRGETGFVLQVKPQSGAFPPGDLELDISGLRDAIGGGYGDALAVSVYRPVDVITDRTLTTAPPFSAFGLESFVPVTRDGLLVIPNFGTSSESGLTIGLGDEPGSQTLRIKHRWVCSNQPSPTKRVAVVASDGSMVDVPGGCSDAPADATVALPGPGPFFLVVQEGYPLPPRCNLPPPPAGDGWELDEFAFNP